jgi:Mor family transcriptional regulator
MNRNIKEDIKKDWIMGKDIPCLASVYNLTCEQVEDILDIKNKKKEENYD